MIVVNGQEQLTPAITLVLQLLLELQQLVILTLKLTVVVIQAGDLIVQVGFHLLTFMSHLLQAFVGPLEFAIDTVEAL